jgi:hypothetical protein
MAASSLLAVFRCYWKMVWTKAINTSNEHT